MLFGRLTGTFAILGLVVSTACSVQSSFSFKNYDDGLFSPVEDLGVLSVSEFTTLGHPLFPDYNVRIKKSDFCDGTVRQVRERFNASSRHMLDVER